MPQNAMSDQGSDCFLTRISMQNTVKVKTFARNPKTRNGLIHVIKIGKSSAQKEVKIRLSSKLVFF